MGEHEYDIDSELWERGRDMDADEHEEFSKVCEDLWSRLR